MIAAPRLQQSIAEVIRRVRMTRADAEEVMQVVVQIGRRQAKDALATVARRVPGTDRALRTADRARRAVGPSRHRP